MSSASYDLVLSSTIWHLSIPCVANLREVRVQAETASTVGESNGPGLHPEMDPHLGMGGSSGHHNERSHRERRGGEGPLRLSKHLGILPLPSHLLPTIGLID